MKQKYLILFLLSLPLMLNAQIGAVPNLPPINPREAGFSPDSIKALNDTISKFRQRDYRFRLLG